MCFSCQKGTRRWCNQRAFLSTFSRTHLQYIDDNTSWQNNLLDWLINGKEARFIYALYVNVSKGFSRKQHSYMTKVSFLILFQDVVLSQYECGFIFTATLLDSGKFSLKDNHTEEIHSSMFPNIYILKAFSKRWAFNSFPGGRSSEVQESRIENKI